MFVDNPKNITRADIIIKKAVNFYSDGFKQIISTFEEESDSGIVEEKQTFKAEAFLVHFIWTIVFWSFLFLFIKY